MSNGKRNPDNGGTRVAFPSDEKKPIGEATSTEADPGRQEQRTSSNVDVEIAKVNGRLDVLDTTLDGKFATLDAKFDGMSKTVDATLGEIKAMLAGQPAKLIVAIIMAVAATVAIAAGILRILDSAPKEAAIEVVEPSLPSSHQPASKL